MTEADKQFILFNSCNNKELEDYWLRNEHYSYPVVLKFFDDKYVESPSTFDTLTYKVFNNKIYFKRWGEEISSPNYKLKDDTFQFIHSDSLIFTYIRKKQEHCIQDIFSQLNINISLPKEYCKEVDVNGHESSLYLSYLNNSLKINFNGETVSSIDTLKNFIWKYNNPKDEFNFHKNRILLYADADCPMSIINNTRNQIAKSGILNVTYITYPENISYLELNGLSMRLPPFINWRDELPDSLKEKIPPPPPLRPYNINKDHNGAKINLFVIGKESVHVYPNASNTKVELNNMQEIIEVLDTVEDYQKYITYSYYTDEATYEDFISFVNLVFSFYYDKRDEYSIKEFNKSYEDLTSDNRDRVKKSYPIIISELSREDFELYMKNF